MKIIDTFQNRLKQAIKINKIKPVQLYEQTGISESLISKYLSGNAVARQNKLNLLSKALNVSPIWLMGYDVSINETKSNQKSLSITSIPILGTVKAGYDYMAQENWEGNINVSENLIKDGAEYFALRVHGDSMSPLLIENDIVIIKKQSNFENGDIVIAIINNEEATIKKVRKIKDSILLQPLNEKYEPLVFSSNELKTTQLNIIGIVKQLERNF